MSNQTSCIYCGSQSYGRPCMFSPTNTHVHMDEPGKCIYCGSPSIGGGCMFNPYGTVHVRGPEYLNNAALKTEKAAILTYLFNMIGSVLEEGNVYKSPLDRLYKRMAGIISSITEPLIEALSLQETPTYKDMSKEQLIKSVEFKNKFKKELESLSKVMLEASDHLPQEVVEKTLVDAIMTFNVRKDKN